MQRADEVGAPLDYVFMDESEVPSSVPQASLSGACLECAAFDLLFLPLVGKHAMHRSFFPASKGPQRFLLGSS